MIRGIRAHVANHNWFAVSIDLVILVVGVFLGTQANNWNQERIDRGEAREFREQIVENIKTNEADVSGRSSYYDQIRVHAVAALAAVRQPGAVLGEPFLIDAYQASQTWLRPFERTAYDELLASGVAREVAGPRARAQLSGYYVSARGFDATAMAVTDFRELLRRSLDLEIQEKIRANCDDRVLNLRGGVQVPALPDECRLDLDPATARRAAARLKAVPGIEQSLTRLIVDIDLKQALFTRTWRNAVNLRRQLEAA